MGTLRRKEKAECSELQDAVANVSTTAALSAALQEHANGCPDCRAVIDEFSASKALLGAALSPQRFQPSPWFVGRVMAAISNREAELKQSLETWTLVPRLAAKLTWVSALALLLAGTWLYERPKVVSHPNDAGGGESLFESPSSATPDDFLASVVEHE